MSLTAHYVDPEWNLVARCLKTQYHPEAHTALNLASFFKEALDDYGMKPGYVVSITTDNAANMIAAAREAGKIRILYIKVPYDYLTKIPTVITRLFLACIIFLETVILLCVVGATL